MPTNRDEHLAWCKERALAYLPGEPVEAMTSMLSDSMLSDLTKHPELAKYPGRLIAPLYYGQRDPREVRKWIEGFN